MLGFGFLALFTVGMAMSAGGSGDDVDVDSTQDNTTDIDPNGENVSLGPLTVEYFAPDDVDPEIEEQINAFVEDLRNEEGLSIEDAVDDLNAFLAEIDPENYSTGDEDSSDADDDDVEAPVEEAEEVARPPQGDQYRDPIVVAEELEAQRILDEIAAAEARQPENLVAVFDSNGDEISDASVLEERGANAMTSDPAYTVTAPDTPNTITVGFDPDNAYLIEYNGETTSISAGLNAIIKGPEPTEEVTQVSTVDAFGEDVIEIANRQTFEGQVDITIDVADTDIGASIAQIDLTNPLDTIHFEFGPLVDGDMHLLFYNGEEGSANDSTSTKRAFLIQTSAGGPPISDAELATLIASEDGQMTGIHIIAEIFLGEESVSVTSNPDPDQPDEVRFSNGINDAPQITSNLAWHVVAEHDEADGASSGSGDGLGSSGDPFDIPDFVSSIPFL